MAIRVIVGDDPVQAADIAWTVTDPGGSEAASFRLESGQIPRPGTDVLITDGLSVCFDGFVEEPGRRLERGREAGSVNCRGRRFELDRNPYSMVYFGRDLSGWTPPGVAREIAIAAASQALGSATAVTGDPPALSLTAQGAWATVSGIRAEAYYEAPPEETIARVLFDWATNANINTDPGFLLQAYSTEDEAAFPENSADVLTGATSGSLSFAPTTPRRKMLVQLAYPSAAGAAGADYTVMLTNLRAVGPHGLQIRGTAAGDQGLYPTDIAAHALVKSRAGFTLRVDGNPGYVLPHSVYRTPTAPSTVIADSMTVLAWHWGVWRDSVLAEPTLILAPPPPAATTQVRWVDCNPAEVVERLSDMHEDIIATFTDAAGGSGISRVSRQHPRLPSGVKGVPLLADLGQATQASADALAATRLLLDQLQGTMAGTATLPPGMLDGRPSHLLRPGRDRVELIGMPSGASRLADASGRPAAARINKLSVRVQNGTPVSTIDFDVGADLVAALEARIAAEATRAGV